MRALCQEDGAPGRHLVITGHGGIGKTALACQIWHDPRASDRFQHRLYLDCEDLSSAAAVFDGLLAIFGVTAPPATAGIALSERLNELASSSKPVLIYLEHLDHVIHLDRKGTVALLCSAIDTWSRSRLLITSRDVSIFGHANIVGRWDSILLLRLRPLPSFLAAQLLLPDRVQHAGAVADMVTRSDCLPLLLIILKGFSYTTPERLQASWDQEGVPPDGHGDRLQSFRTSVELSLKLARLNNQAWLHLSDLALPAPQGSRDLNAE